MCKSLQNDSSVISEPEKHRTKLHTIFPITPKHLDQIELNEIWGKIHICDLVLQGNAESSVFC
jgi:hypothetical protein